MTEGLRIVAIGGGTYPYVLIGWVQRRVGDEYAVHGARCIARFGRNQSLAGLAANGPYKGEGPTKLLEASVEPEEVHRLLVRRCLPCNVEAWADECPRPASWEASQ